MATLEYSVKGNFKKLNSFFEKMKEGIHESILDECGQMGVDALRDATPRRTGKTANSWEYRIVRDKDKVTSIEWYNTNYSNNGESIALLIQYGHATQSGYFIKGRDYINPAIEPVFEEIAEKVLKEVGK